MNDFSWEPAARRIITALPNAKRGDDIGAQPTVSSIKPFSLPLPPLGYCSASTHRLSIKVSGLSISPDRTPANMVAISGFSRILRASTAALTPTAFLREMGRPTE